MPIDTSPKGTSTLILMRELAILAGLLHDLGKSTSRFQDKLTRITQGKEGGVDPVRHEVVSTLMAEALWEALPDLKDAKALSTWCNEQFQRVLDPVLQDAEHKGIVHASHSIATRLTRMFDEVAWHRSTAGKTAMLWIVLSHHRMPEGRHGSVEGLVPTIGYIGEHHFFIKVKEVADAESTAQSDDLHYRLFKDNLVIASVTENGQTCLQPWDDRHWCEDVLSSYRSLSNLLSEQDAELPENALTDDSAFISALALMGRSSMVYADYTASIDKLRSQVTSGTTFANCIETDGRVYFADSLTRHLREVGRLTAVYFDEMFINRDGFVHRFPALDLSYREKHIPPLDQDSADERYIWQDTVRKGLLPLRSDAPFFASVVGKTGSGKTRGNIILMHALKNDMRYTCAIGLRSLVKQTWSVYQESFIGLKKDHLALLVGEASIDETGPVSERLGSGNDVIQDADLLLGDYYLDGAINMENPLAQLFDHDKQKAMLSKPVQVMTVDHIMPGASLSRSSDLKVMMHLMGTDIILDEIDDYPADSLAALIRMAFVSGFFGRSFSLSSATASSVIQKSFYAAWRKGHEHHQSLYPSDPQGRGVLISHVPDNELKVTALDEFDVVCDDFVSKIARHASTPDEIKHRFQVLALPDRVTGYEVEARYGNLYSYRNLMCFHQHKSLIEGMLALHDDHHIVDGQISVSSGFIRFNQIASAQHLTLALDRHDDPDTLMVPICYHSAMMFTDRTHVEQLLLDMNNRKDMEGVTGSARLLHHPFVKESLVKAREKGVKRLIMVVCTTNIIEVGRDHDYDWCILEPSSTRSLVQSVGRVWRHRKKRLGEGSNVRLLPQNVRSYGISQYERWMPPEKIRKVWTSHGIEDDVIEKEPLIEVRYPLTSHSEQAMKVLGISLDGIPKPPKGHFKFGNLKAKMALPIMSPRFLWEDAMKNGCTIHAGLCLTVPSRVRDMLFPALEMAQQQMHLQGPLANRDLNYLKPSGLSFASDSATRLTANHPLKRTLREPDEGFSLFMQSEEGSPGRNRQWYARDQDGGVAKAQLETIHVKQGQMYIPADIDTALKNNRGWTEEMCTHLSIRADQMEDLPDFAYIAGVGLTKLKV